MIFDETSVPPSGIMEFALNRQSKCAWIKARTAQHAANIFYQAIVDQAHDI